MERTSDPLFGTELRILSKPELASSRSRLPCIMYGKANPDEPAQFVDVSLDWQSETHRSLGVSKRNNKFFYTAAAARDYGLTVGTRDTDKIELGTLGREIVFAGDEAI